MPDDVWALIIFTTRPTHGLIVRWNVEQLCIYIAKHRIDTFIPSGNTLIVLPQLTDIDPLRTPIIGISRGEGQHIRLDLEDLQKCHPTLPESTHYFAYGPKVRTHADAGAGNTPCRQAVRLRALPSRRQASAANKSILGPIGIKERNKRRSDAERETKKESGARSRCMHCSRRIGRGRRRRPTRGTVSRRTRERSQWA